MDLVEFLRARLNEDEAVAREAREAADREPVSFRPMEGAQTAGALSVMEMMVRWHPARVLADVEAKRQAVGLLSADAGDKGNAIRRGWALDILRSFAAAYADHPDCDESWRP